VSPQDDSTAKRTFEPADRAASAYPPGRADLELATDQPPVGRQPGPSGLGFVSATVAMFAFVGAIFVLLGVGGSVATGGAILLMLLGVAVVSRYMQRISRTRSSPTQPRSGLAGMNEDLAVSDEESGELSPYDFPRSNPARQQLEREAA